VLSLGTEPLTRPPTACLQIWSQHLAPVHCLITAYTPPHPQPPTPNPAHLHALQPSCTPFRRERRRAGAPRRSSAGGWRRAAAGTRWSWPPRSWGAPRWALLAADCGRGWPCVVTWVGAAAAGADQPSRRVPARPGCTAHRGEFQVPPLVVVVVVVGGLVWGGVGHGGRD
jgi:hypothetical protein